MLLAAITDSDFQRTIDEARAVGSDAEIAHEIGITKPMVEKWRQNPPRQQVKDHYFERLKEFVAKHRVRGVRD